MTTNIEQTEETIRMQDVYGAVWDARAKAWQAHYNNPDLSPLSHSRILRAVEQLSFALDILNGKSTKIENELGVSLR